MTRQQILDLYFLDARHKLIELAAFVDRVERADGKGDFRLNTFRAALAKLNGKKKNKAKDVLLAFSDLTTKPIARAAGKGAVGAWKKENENLYLQPDWGCRRISNIWDRLHEVVSYYFLFLDFFWISYLIRRSRA